MTLPSPTSPSATAVKPRYTPGRVIAQTLKWVVGTSLTIAVLAVGAAFLGLLEGVNVQTRECTVVESEFVNGRRDADSVDLDTSNCGNHSSPLFSPTWVADGVLCDATTLVLPGGVYRVTSGGFDLFGGFIRQDIKSIEFVSIPQDPPACVAGEPYLVTFLAG